MFDILEKLTNTNGVSGDEGAVRDIIVNYAREYCDNIKVDRIGNVIIHKKRENAPKVMLCAHMDEVGFIVSHITDEGYVKFKPVGGIDANILSAKPVVIGEKQVKGVITSRPKHLMKESAEKVKVTDLFIDIGAKNKQQALENVQLGDYIAFKSEYVEFGGERIKAKALDDRVGCAIMLDLLKYDFPYDMYYVFTVQEEIGCRGAKACSSTIMPDLAIVIEGTTCGDLPKTPDDKVSTRLGEGVALSIFDPGCIYDSCKVKSLYEYAETHGIKVQYKTTFTGGNDSKEIHVQEGGIKTVAVNVPCRYIHSPSCVADKADITSCRDLLMGWLQDEQV